VVARVIESVASFNFILNDRIYFAFHVDVEKFQVFDVALMCSTKKFQNFYNDLEFFSLVTY